MFKKALKIVTLLLVSIFILFALVFVYMGGYWENFPILDRVSGKKHFQNYVSNPVPKSIYDVRSGYSGFPQGIIITKFKVNDSFLESDLNKWNIKSNTKKLFARYEGIYGDRVFGYIGTNMRDAPKKNIDIYFDSIEKNTNRVIMINREKQLGLMYIN